MKKRKLEEEPEPEESLACAVGDHRWCGFGGCECRCHPRCRPQRDDDDRRDG